MNKVRHKTTKIHSCSGDLPRRELNIVCDMPSRGATSAGGEIGRDGGRCHCDVFAVHQSFVAVTAALAVGVSPFLRNFGERAGARIDSVSTKLTYPFEQSLRNEQTGKKT